MFNFHAPHWPRFHSLWIKKVTSREGRLADRTKGLGLDAAYLQAVQVAANGESLLQGLCQGLSHTKREFVCIMTNDVSSLVIHAFCFEEPEGSKAEARCTSPVVLVSQSLAYHLIAELLG